MDRIIQDRVREWTSPPFDKSTIEEISTLVKQGNEKELADRFFDILEFGTGGLRGVIGAGTNRMNVYTVGMATQGLANYINIRGRASDGVVIARDSRRMSDVFAGEAASILAGNGIRVYYFDEITPTPLCSFAIRHYGAVSGIVVTASHNPPEYNGYKVYWDDGGQVVPPFDKEIIEEVRKIESISAIRKTVFADAVNNGTIRVIVDEVKKVYLENLEKVVLRPRAESPVSIVYTPLHGTGYRIVPEVLGHFGFRNVHTVEPQMSPDGNFPTVKYPNPEEREALALSIETALKCGADLILATDPDADRMGVGFCDGKGSYRLINGNQIGTMLEYYLLSRLAAEKKLPSNASIIKTIVTTDLQERIAESFGCAYDNVLTGFKYIAMKMKEYDETGERRFIFGGEESYGYLPVPFVRDKDAVSSCYFFAEMTDWLMGQGRTLNDFLDEIYARYGLYMEDLHSLTLKGLDGMKRIGQIMDALRSAPPQKFAGTVVAKVADIKNLVLTDARGETRSPIKGLFPSDVMQFFLEDGTKITMRPSGTEPKIKFYFSVNMQNEGKETASAEEVLKKRIDSYKKDLLSKVEKI
jgi:phosphoglucomutase